MLDKKIVNSKEFRELIDIVENVRGRMITSKDLEILIKIKEIHKASNQIIKYLLEVEKNLSNIEKILNNKYLFKEKEKNKIADEIILFIKDVFNI
jgi:hypothetical protein